jgi:hypothetical protein
MSDITQQQMATRQTIAMIDGRVKEGERRLDEQGPSDWFELVDLDDFVFHQCSKCVLGWVFASPESDHTGFVLGVRKLNIDKFDSWKFGFDTGPNDPWTHENLLAASWRRTILARRAKAASAS